MLKSSFTIKSQGLFKVLIPKLIKKIHSNHHSKLFQCINTGFIKKHLNNTMNIKKINKKYRNMFLKELKSIK